MARAFCTKLAQFFRRKPRDFCVGNVENQLDRSRRRPQNAGKTLEQLLYACCAGRAGFSELANVFCTEICGKPSRFSPEIAKVSMKFDALFVHHTRPAPANNAKKLNKFVRRCAVHVRGFCAHSLRVARSFCTKTAQFFEFRSKTARF